MPVLHIVYPEAPVNSSTNQDFYFRTFQEAWEPCVSNIIS